MFLMCFTYNYTKAAARNRRFVAAKKRGTFGRKENHYILFDYILELVIPNE